MTTRLILTIWLMIGLMMPCAWANTWGEDEINEWKKSATKPYETYMEKRSALSLSEEDIRLNSPLSKLTIEAYEWFEGDTYYIRYTFNNPTDELIEETVLRTNVLLHAHNRTPLSPKIIKRDPSPEWVLRIEPQSSTSRTITLPKEPAFTHFIHELTTFYLANDSTLSYYMFMPFNEDITPDKIDFYIEPTSLNKGILTLTITNRTSETLHELRNIKLYPRTGKYKSGITAEPLPASIPLNLKLNETKTVQIPIPLWTYLLPNAACTAYLDLDIDNMRYNYVPHEKRFTLTARQTRYTPLPEVSRPLMPSILIFGTMEPINDYMIYYLTFYNNTDQLQKIDRFAMSSDYEDMFCTQKNIYWELSIQDNPIYLNPIHSKRYAVALPIVTDTIETALTSTTTFRSGVSWDYVLDHHPIISAKPLHDMQKLIYEPLPFSVLDIIPNYPHSLDINQ